MSARLRWQCRRGMRELDELLLGYLDGRYAQAGDSEKSAFRKLLDLSDPELMTYLLGTTPPPPELHVVIDAILRRTEA